MNLSIMKNYISKIKISIILILFVTSLYAKNTVNSFETCMQILDDCDLCGCATSSGGMGFMSLNNIDFIGVRYINQRFESKEGIFNNSPTIDEDFNTFQIWGKKQISKKISISAIIPYLDLSRSYQNGNTEGVNGIGDISFIGWYQFNFFKKLKKNNKPYASREPSNHKLQIGVGVKLPTGEFRQALTTGVNPGFQVGTGSLDVILSSFYAYTQDRWGISTNLSYFYKTENNENYRFGNQVSLSSRVFALFEAKKSVIMPFIGITADHFNAVEEFGEKINDTEGYLANGMFGAELSFSKYLIGANFSLPVSQDLVGGDVVAQNRLSLYLNYKF